LKTLEPYEGKLSSTVPRGERRSNPPDLPNMKISSALQNLVLEKKRQNA